MLRGLVLALGAPLALANAGGAPNCETTFPTGMVNAGFNFGNATTPWTFTGPTTAVGGGSDVTLTLGNGAATYKGISMKCMAGGSEVGSFTIPSGFEINGACTQSAGLTHSTKNAKTTSTFTWVAPTAATANVMCTALVLDSGDKWHTNIMAATFSGFVRV